MCSGPAGSGSWHRTELGRDSPRKELFKVLDFLQPLGGDQALRLCDQVGLWSLTVSTHLGSWLLLVDDRELSSQPFILCVTFLLFGPDHRASLVAQLVKNLPAVQGPSSIPGSGRSVGEGNGYPLQYSWASLVAQLVKNPPAMQETWVWSLGQEDPLKGMATHSSILAWRIPWAV